MSLVAIVGRPNVGKSTIFNILTGSKSAIVADYSGLTRDRKYGNLKNSQLILIDTGGLNEDSDDMSSAIREQTDLAIQEADSLLFVVDAIDGLLPTDKEIAKILRRHNKNITLLVNKADNLKLEETASEFSALGFDKSIFLSASHNKGFTELTELLKNFDELEDTKNYISETDTLKIAIIGRPNAGKSTLINALLGEERLVVSHESGTTRDSIDVVIKTKKQEITLIDTAGMRRKRSISEETEKFSVSKSVDSIKRSDLVLLLIDGSENIVDQDIHLLGLTLAIGRPVLVTVNKIDLLTKQEKTVIETKINRKLKFANYLKLHYISAKEKRGLKKLIRLALEIHLNSLKDLETSILNKILKKALFNQQPAMAGRFRPKLRYAHSGGQNPPKVVIHGNNLKQIQDSYTEKFSVSKSVDSIKRSDLVLLLIDGSENIVDQDIHLLGLTLAIGRPVLVTVNKIDLLTKQEKTVIETKINRKLKFANYLKLHYISAKEKRGLKKLIRLALEIHLNSLKDLETSILNKILKKALFNQQPAMAGRFRPKLRYAHSGGQNPPKVVIHGNNLKQIQDSYTRYLEKCFREHLGLGSTPLEILYKEQINPFKNKPNLLNERQIKKRKRIIKRRKK